jgi:hypothetical protein
VTPTQRSKKHLESQGYRVAVVEKWNPHASIRQDLWGCIDIIAIRENETLAVQTTSGSNVSARVKKIADAEATPDMRKAGWRIHVHGWTKGANNRYRLREVDVS